MEKRKVYVACALTYAPQDFVEGIKILKEKLSEKFEVLDFVGTGGEPKEIYEWDIHHCVKNADIIIALCDFPSIGLGYEMATMLEKYNKPVFAFAHNDAKVTKLVLGIQHPAFIFNRFEHMNEIMDHISLLY
jgi:hypothetical protein